MGVNLVPTIENFNIDQLSPDDLSYELGCIERTKNKILRFTLKLHNRGNKDLDIGNPANRPDLFIKGGPFNFQFKEKFYTFVLKDSQGNIKSQGYKVAFCLMDGQRHSCENQGISTRDFDTYDSGLPCQFVAIDDLPDGEYILEATANAYSVQQVKEGKRPIIEEDNYEDNIVRKRLRINNDQVEELGDA